MPSATPTAAAIVYGFCTFAAWAAQDIDAMADFAERCWALAEGRLNLPHQFGIMPTLAYASNGAYLGPQAIELLASCQCIVEQYGIVDLATPVSMGLLNTNRPAEAAAFAERMYELASSRGAVAAAAWSTMAVGMATHRTGDLSTSERWLVLGRQLGEALGQPFIVATAQADLAWVSTLRGRFAESDQSAQEVEQLAGHLAITASLELARFGRVTRQLLMGDSQLALAFLHERSTQPAQLAEFYPAVYELIEALIRLGAPDDARALAPAR